MFSCTGTIANMKSPVKPFGKPPAEESIKKLYRVFLKARDEKTLDALLYDLLTPQEVVSIAERLQILTALAHGDTIRKVARKTKTSISKINRGSNVFQFGKTNWK